MCGKDYNALPAMGPLQRGSNTHPDSGAFSDRKCGVLARCVFASTPLHPSCCRTGLGAMHAPHRAVVHYNAQDFPGGGQVCQGGLSLMVQ